jgi:hypothetical protein
MDENNVPVDEIDIKSLFLFDNRICADSTSIKRVYSLADNVMKSVVESDSFVDNCKLYMDDVDNIRCEPCNMGFKSKRSLGAHRVHCVHFQANKRLRWTPPTFQIRV